MCIRDSRCGEEVVEQSRGVRVGGGEVGADPVGKGCCSSRSCLLYTSDAADERSRVDLGGPGIIKKKKNEDL